jgi:bifunctional DNase/RNase
MSAAKYVEVKIENISLFNYNFIILLRHGVEEQVLPICIAAAEAHSIAAAINKQSFPRPLTHDLLKTILGAMDGTVNRVHVNDLKNGTFYARIYIQQGARVFDVDSRPSDAIAVALRYGAPIYVREDILRDNSVHLSQAQEGRTSDDKPLAKSAEAPAEPSSALPGDRREQLKRELQEAVSAEDYERAAKLRDELAQLEKGN